MSELGKEPAWECDTPAPVVVCAFAVREVVNVCPISSAKRATQKVEFRTVEEEKQKEVVVVEVPEPKPADQIREKPGIAVVVAKTLCSAFPILYMLVPDNSKFHQIWWLSLFISLQEEFCSEVTQPSSGRLLKFPLCPSLDRNSCGEVGKILGCAGTQELSC